MRRFGSLVQGRGGGRSLERMRSLWLLSDCTDRELRFVESISTPVNAHAGQSLIRQNAHGREFFISASGTAGVSIDDQPTGLIEPGYFFGELALLCGCRRTATVTATTSMELLAFSQREFATLLDARIPSITNKMLTALARRSRPHALDQRGPERSHSTWASAGAS